VNSTNVLFQKISIPPTEGNGISWGVAVGGSADHKFRKFQGRWAVLEKIPLMERYGYFLEQK